PLLQRICVRLGGEDRYVGGDARQHLVAGDQYPKLRGMQAQVLRRVAPADHGMPAATADENVLAIHDPPKTVRQRVYRLAEAAEARLIGAERLLIPTRGMVEPERIGRRLAARVGDEHSAGEIFEPGGPQPTVVLP